VNVCVCVHVVFLRGRVVQGILFCEQLPEKTSRIISGGQILSDIKMLVVWIRTFGMREIFAERDQILSCSSGHKTCLNNSLQALWPPRAEFEKENRTPDTEVPSNTHRDSTHL
jgi:hypothetical protein